MDNDASSLEDILEDFENEHGVIAATARAELAALRAVAEAARGLLEQYEQEPLSYGDGTKAYRPVWDYARDSKIAALAAALAQVKP